MMGATVGEDDNQSKAALLKTVSDPKTFADRLQVLETQKTEIKTLLGQVKQAQEEAQAEREKAEVTNAATTDGLRLITVKEADLVARETALAERANRLDQSNTQLEQAKAKYLAEAQATEDDFSTRRKALVKAEQDHKDRVAKDLADAAQALSDQQAVLEQNYRAKAAAASASHADAVAKASAADAAKAAADQSKLEYEGKLAALKSLVGA